LERIAWPALWRVHGLGRRVRKQFSSTTYFEHSLPVAENMRNREFDVSTANRIWVSDITHISTDEGWIYLCIVIDLYSRKVAGLAIDTWMKADRVLQALKMALVGRRLTKGRIFHSDRGSRYIRRVAAKESVH
jgi:putative transposase